MKYILFLLCSTAAFAACDVNATTANFGTQLVATNPGQTICLASGTYASWNATGVTKTSPGVRITPVAGGTVTMAFSFNQPSPTIAWLIFDGITFTKGDMTGPAHDITFQNSTFVDKINIEGGANPNACSICPAMNNNNILFNNDVFNMSANPSGANGFEGRLNILGNTLPAGVTITNSQFTGGCADGIQVDGGGNGYTIGPGNTFFALTQGSCGPHVDSIQFVGTSSPGPVITGNYFHDDSTGIIGYDNANDATITNNVVRNITQDGTAIAGNATGLISHNTLFNNNLSCGVTHQGNVCHSSFTDNIALGFILNGGGTGVPTLLDYNLCTMSVCPSGFGGTHNITGTPTYVGGSNPTTFNAYALTSTSVGHAAANDGKDMGITVSTSAPAAPTGLTAVVN